MQMPPSIQAGQMEVVRWADRLCFPWTQMALNKAMMGGLRPAVQLALDRGVAWTDDATYFAAEGGPEACREVLWWAVEQGCPWDSETTGKLGRRGELDLLQEVVRVLLAVSRPASRYMLYRVGSWTSSRGRHVSC